MLAEALVVQRATISNYEIGRRSPGLDDLKRIADYFGVGLDYFSISNESKDVKLEICSKIMNYFKQDDKSYEEKTDLFNEVVKLYTRKG